jgi:hypothetical protein
MEMLLMGVCLSLFGLAVTCVAFGAAARPEREYPVQEAQAERVKPSAPARFFVSDVLTPHTRVPIDALLLQIENHVRLEQAAAESFLQAPTSALLHSRTMSTFVN